MGDGDQRAVRLPYGVRLATEWCWRLVVLAAFVYLLLRVLGHFEVLQRLDTENVPPTAQVHAMHNRFEPDSARPSWPVEDILLNAPLREEGYFRVRGVLE